MFLALISLKGFFSGAETCGCFGAVRIPPGPVALADFAAVLAIWTCCDRRSIREPARVGLRFVAFLVGTAAIGGIATLTVANTSPATQRIFDVAPRLYDEGNYRRAKYELPIVNTTDERVRFRRTIGSSCGCANAMLAQHTLGRGDGTTLHVEIDHTGIVGARTVFLTLTDDQDRRWEYTVRASAYPRIRFDSTELYLGELSPGTTHERTIVAHTYAIDGTPPMPVLVSADSPHVRASVGASRLEQLPDSVTRRVTDVHLAIVAPTTSLGDVIRLTVACEADVSNKAHLPIRWSLQSPYRVSPERLFFGSRRSPQDSLRDLVLVRRKDGGEFRVTDVAIGDATISYRAEPMDDRRLWRIWVEVDSAAKHPIWTELTLHTDSETVPTIVIPVAFLGDSLRG